jgi:REP element-mobilizing transposase RayT
MRQTGFSFLKNYKKEFGGSLLVGKRKTQRPLSTKMPIHLVLKSSHSRLFRPDDLRLAHLFKKEARRFGIKVYDFAVNWNHIHFLIQIPSRESYVRFIRAVTSGIVVVLSHKFGREMTGPYTSPLHQDFIVGKTV